MVKKKNEKWRMCVDFKDLNKACPKDSFPLPHIDQLIDATAGHELLIFLDAYSGYNQILMEVEDQDKTTFITHQGTYCYKVMPFGLKNVRATYQRLVTKMFKDQLGKTMKVYIDDMLVKSKRKKDHIDHLKEAFNILRQYDTKLNPKKCTFGVTSGKFLGFLAEPGECLLVYLAVSEVAVSAILVRESKGLKLALKYGARRVVLHCDSQLIVNQVTGTFQIKEQRLRKYQTEIHKLLPEFDEC
ncbi:PREDICTED: uncharacterized protein LOC109229871 [Nicotiana attenuata]|uniref:uncharacterized protein LOC109229871 n=1 Tax=Nicotiana attenuata TaxID=49451 RepID=UPI0009048135|nr:PREDICTED: uncharacterized protein LOC109229871 [Nicotiana attenuata]